MKLHRPSVLLMAGIILIVGISLWLNFREPRYQGKSLSQWLEIHPDFSSGHFSRVWTEESARQSVIQASNAVVQIGSAAVPWAMRWSLQTNDAPLQWARDLWNRSLPAGWQQPDPMEPVSKALFCVRLLPADFKQQNPELVRRVRQGDSIARGMLEYQGVHALEALVELLDDFEPKTRQAALDLISFCGSAAAGAEASLRSRLAVEADLRLSDEIKLALTAIGRIDDGMVHDCGRALLNDNPDESRAKTLVAILASKQVHGMSYLLQGTTNGHPPTRLASVSVLCLVSGNGDFSSDRGVMMSLRSKINVSMVPLKFNWPAFTAATATNLLARPEPEARLVGLQLATNQLFDPRLATNRMLVRSDVLFSRIAALTNDSSAEVVDASRRILATISPFANRP